MSWVLFQWLLWTAAVATLSGAASAYGMYWILTQKMKSKNSQRELLDDGPEYIVVTEPTLLAAINIANSQSTERVKVLDAQLIDLNDKLLLIQYELMEVLSKKDPTILQRLLPPSKKVQ
jgi:hypothetical protein